MHEGNRFNYCSTVKLRDVCSFSLFRNHSVNSSELRSLATIMAQWIVAKWIDENSCTVISSKDVTDKEYCTDKEITVVTRSKGQVELYQAKALFVSGKFKELQL